MKKGDKLYYVDIAGNLTNYVITDVTEEKVMVAWEEDTSVNTVFERKMAEKMVEKYKTIESAKNEAEMRKGV